MMKKSVLSIGLAVVMTLLVALGCAPQKTVTALPRSAPVTGEPAEVILMAGGDTCLGYSYSFHLNDGRVSYTVSPEKYAEYERGYSDVLIAYRSMLNSSSVHTESKGFVPVRLGQGYVPMNVEGGAFGPEVGLAEILSAYNGDRTTYLIKFSGAGTSGIGTQWNPNGGAYYEEMLAFFEQSLQALSEQGVAYEVSAFCFLQGDSDARYDHVGYGDRLRTFVNAVRLEYADVATEQGMAFIDVGVAPFYKHFDRLNADKRTLADSDGRNYFVDTVAAGLTSDRDNMDRKHYDAYSAILLGQMLGRAVRESHETTPHGDRLTIRKRPVPFRMSGASWGAFCDGLYAEARWNAYASDGAVLFEVEVKDSLLTANDGVELTVGAASNVRAIPNGTMRVTVYADGRTVEREYKNTAFAERQGTPAASASVSYLTTQETAEGYRVIAVIRTDADAVAASVALINANGNASRVVSPLYGVSESDYGSWAYVTEQGVAQSPYRKGAFFGANGVLNDVGLWELSHDDAGADRSVTTTVNEWLNVLYATQRVEGDFFFEVELSALAVHNGELWGKLGIQVTTANNTGLFYYVDAWGNGTDMQGTQLGYARRVNASTFDSYVALDAHACEYGYEYQYGINFVCLAVRRLGNEVTLYCNGSAVETLDFVSGLGTSPAYVGIGSFNITMKARSYRLVTGDAVRDLML